MTNTSGSGAGIVEALITRYGRMRSYRDQGVVRTQLRTGHPPIEMPFDTAFSTPSLFRFAFASPHPYPGLRHVVTRWIVGCNGTKSYLYIRHAEDRAELRVEQDISTVVAGATGVSDGAVHTIARLLLPQVGGLALAQLRDLSVAGEVQIDGVVCHRIAGLHPSGGRWEMSVEKESLLLRSLSDGPAESGFRGEQQRWAIRVDEALDSEIFAMPAVD